MDKLILLFKQLDSDFIYQGNRPNPFLRKNELIELTEMIQNCISFYELNNITDDKIYSLNLAETEKQMNQFNSKKSEKNTKKTKIYIMVDLSNNYTKIGRSINPVIREKTLQSEKPEIKLIKYYDGCMQDEIDLHKKFESKRIRGEWFNLTKEDINEIDLILTK